MASTGGLDDLANGQCLAADVHGLAGGSGASTFAVNLAWELATATKTDAPRVCLLDLDFQYGSAATYLDLPRKELVYEFLSDLANADSEALLQAMVTFNDKLHVLTAPSDMLPLDILGPEDISRLIDMAQANFDFVVIDMPKTVVAWTDLGRPALIVACRAGAWPRPAGSTQPMKTSSTASGARPARCTMSKA